jgi:hypothetical protein
MRREPDPPETGEAEHLPADLLTHEALLVPHTQLHRRIGGRQLSGQCQNLRHRQFRDRDAVGARSVHHDDPPRRRGLDVDVIDSGTRAGNRPQLRGRGDDVSSHLGGAAHDNRVGVGHIGLQLVGRTARARINGPSLGAEEGESGSGEVVSDYDVHVRRSPEV